MSQQLFIGVVSDDKFQEEWMLIRRLPTPGEYRWLLCTGGPTTGDPLYTRTEVKTDNVPVGLKKHYHLAWLSEQIVDNVYKKALEKTIPGPNKWFIVRFLDQLARVGLIEQKVVEKWKRRAVYSEPEKNCFRSVKADEHLLYVDRVFRDEGRHVSGSLERSREIYDPEQEDTASMPYHTPYRKYQTTLQQLEMASTKMPPRTIYLGVADVIDTNSNSRPTTIVVLKEKDREQSE
ncbi:hypothetical protein BDV19DRAFT_390298 [Aspergillus venezuelensis]